MRRLVLLIAGGILLIAGPVSAGRSDATLTIEARGAEMEFRALDLTPGAFRLAAGAKRTFRVRPGRYVVVQAPPITGYQLRVSCTDGGSVNQYDLTAGERLTCTFYAEAP